MGKVMTAAELKKSLKSLSQKDLVDLVYRLYKSDDKNKQILNTMFLGDTYALSLLTEYKAKMKALFFPHNMNCFTPMSTIKKLITDYKKTTNNLLLSTDLMLYYVECGTKLTNDYGDINEPFYNSLCNVFGVVVENINGAQGAEIYLHLKERLSKLVVDTQDIGWAIVIIYRRHSAKLYGVRTNSLKIG